MIDSFNSPPTVNLNGLYVRDPRFFAPESRTEKGSRRGGVHLCGPNFGPDPNDQLPQHGYLRGVKWLKGDNGIYTATIEDEGVYGGLVCSSTIEFGEGSFHQSLTLENPDGSGRGMPVAPGFHPYFLPSILSKEIAKLCNPEPILKVVEDGKIKLGNGHIELGDRLGEFAVVVFWSDSPESYGCVEPTAAGPTLDPARPGVVVLEPGQSEEWSMKITSGA